ncbi:Resistance to glucose repression protein 1 [Nakaseomyces bracarensis]|uniref:Resistance to glucose repression protein 1 n=1 Tax=Nakaseomyces bracarensis TaxID=273131 RepID=A0ABR4NY18_9SACH
MSTNLADYFKKEDKDKKDLPYDDYEDMGPSVSMAVEAEDEDAFKKSTFNLKRTRSMGLLDEFIDPTKKLLEKDGDEEGAEGQGQGEGQGEADRNGVSMEKEDYYNNDPERYDNLHEHSTSVSPPPADNDNYFIPQDDNDVVVEPERHVDYLSHHWKESEISNSWKYIILKKKKRDVDLVNAARLENASWRTWAKARNHLKTVSPEILNWSKDSDVTWLYGPIVRDEHKKKNQKIKSTNDEDETDSDPDLHRGYGSDDETSKRLRHHHSNGARSVTPKPILKKRTVSEIIEENALWKLNEARKHVNDMKHASVVMDPNGSKDVHDDYDALAARVNAQYYYTPQSRSSSRQPSRENSENNIHSIQRNSSASPNIHYRDGASPANEIRNSASPANNLRYASTSASPLVASPLLSDPSAQSPSIEAANSSKPPLSSILTTPSSSSTTNIKQKKNTPKRHIHFNDRVEQCMALRYSSSESSMKVEDNAESEDETTRPVTPSSAPSNNNIRFVRRGGASPDTNKKIPETEKQLSDSSSSSQSDEGEEEEEEDFGGLFINARFSRRSDSGIHSPVTDTSSIGSAKSRHGVRPIIKLLPATTLNYGSDEESENSDINNYGNAISHNVNTSRGYDYIYDYNSVYTGDTSNFLPLDHCDIIDVPEGIGLDTSLVDEDQSPYEFPLPAGDLQAHKVMMPSPSNTPPILSKKSKDSPIFQSASTGSASPSRQDFLYDKGQGYSSSDEEQQFIEDSQLNSSDEDDEILDSDEDSASDEGLSLKRTVTLGKSGTATSIKDLSIQQDSNSDYIPPIKTRSFITGESINVPNFNTEQRSGSGTTTPQLKRNQSSKSFIFNSDSGDEDSSDSSESTGFFGIETPKPVNPQGHATVSSIGDKRSPHPPSNRISSNDLSKNFKIPSNSISAPDVAASDIAIKGSFSPRYDSVKSVINKEGILSDKSNISTSPLQSSTNVTGKQSHTTESDNENSTKDLSNESLQKMMKNAKSAASKYISSWKKTDDK